MGVLRCVDGSVLSIEAVACHDRLGQPYEITLKLARDSVAFAAVGQRCGYQLSDLAARVRAARQDPEQAAVWPDPDDRFPFPEPGTAAGRDSGRGHRLRGARADHAGQLGVGLPGDHEYFSLRSHERFDLPETGELRCVLRSSAVWVGECVGVGSQSQAGRGRRRSRPAVPGQRAASADPVAESAVTRPSAEGERAPTEQHSHRTWRQRPGGQGRWQLNRRAVIEAWGAGGVGVRAVLTSAELVAFLDTVLNGPDSAVATGANPIEGPQAGGHLPDSSRVA